jgi:poly(A) polymerase/tRNA nucleotidyltransferase (CCA-adding enzyme)
VERLERRISPPAFLADPALGAVLAVLPRARLVGGCVRDTLLDLPVADIDLATPDLPESVMAALRDGGLRAVPTGIGHGTVTAVSQGRAFEITTLRRDVATDGRRAVVAFTEDWREDAARRDFTINAMSLTRDGRLADYFGGEDDLRAGRLRFVGDPAARLAEDRLRALRYFRFFGRYASQAPDAATAAALRAAAADLRLLSSERVWSELKRILATPDPTPGLRLMRELGVLGAVLPEAGDPAPLQGLVAAGAPAEPMLRLVALLAPGAASPAARLRLSNAEAEGLDALRRGPAIPMAADDAALLPLLADEPATVLIGRAWLAGAPDTVRARLGALPRPVFPLTGADALAAGIGEGPGVGAALAAVRRWWKDQGCAPDRAACLARLAGE